MPEPGRSSFQSQALLLLATGLGAGRIPYAPGLAGSAVGWLWWWAVLQLGQPWSGAVWSVQLLLAVPLAGAAAQRLGHPDPPRVVIDEIVAMPVALMWAGAVAWQAVLAFGLFRLFDVWKPWPIRSLQRLRGGWGIVADDLAAALLAAAVTFAAAAIVGRVTA